MNNRNDDYLRLTHERIEEMNAVSKTAIPELKKTPIVQDIIGRVCFHVAGILVSGLVSAAYVEIRYMQHIGLIRFAEGLESDEISALIVRLVPMRMQNLALTGVYHGVGMGNAA